MSVSQKDYYIPDSSQWPIIAVLALFITFLGTALTIHHMNFGSYILIAGFLLLMFLFYGWFSDIVKENNLGVYNSQVNRSFRIGMFWFISSEFFFFLAFFGSLFYIRMFSLPWIGGEGYLGVTSMLYEGYEAIWPTSGPKDVKFTPMGAMGIPLLNTFILLSSGVTVTWAHHALLKGNKQHLVWGLIATVLLGLTFVGFQAYEYIHAYEELNLTLKTGIYGSIFYMLTGFHGFHVILGVTMLIVILIRAQLNHFTPEKHFAFEAVSWYWHFVDVVWLGLYTIIYWL